MRGRVVPRDSRVAGGEDEDGWTREVGILEGTGKNPVTEVELVPPTRGLRWSARGDRNCRG